MALDRILVALDGSRLAEESLSHATRFARAYNSRVFLVQVLDARDAWVEHGPEDLDWRLHKMQVVGYLSSLTERLARENVKVEFRVLEGRAPDAILDVIRDLRIDLVVLCAHGRGGASEFPLGGTAQKIIAAPETSVLVVRTLPRAADAGSAYARILVPLDGSQRAAWAVSLVAGTVEDASPEIILLQVVVPPVMPRNRPLTREEVDLRDKLVECNRRAAAAYLEEIEKRFSGVASIRTQLEISPHIVDTIETVAAAEAVDLIALTAHGASGLLDRSHGTICQSVLLSASHPVLILQDRPARYRDQSDPQAYSMERKACPV